MTSIEKFQKEIDMLKELDLKRDEIEMILERKIREFLNEAISVPRNFLWSLPIHLLIKIGVKSLTMEQYLEMQKKREIFQCKEITLPEKVVYIDYKNKHMPLVYEQLLPLYSQLKRETIDRYELFKYMLWNELVHQYYERNCRKNWYEIPEKDLEQLKEDFPEFWERLLNEHKDFFEAYDKRIQQRAKIEKKYNMKIKGLSEEERGKIAFIFYKDKFIEITD